MAEKWKRQKWSWVEWLTQCRRLLNKVIHFPRIIPVELEVWLRILKCIFSQNRRSFCTIAGDRSIFFDEPSKNMACTLSEPLENKGKRGSHHVAAQEQCTKTAVTAVPWVRGRVQAQSRCGLPRTQSDLGDGSSYGRKRAHTRWLVHDGFKFCDMKSVFYPSCDWYSDKYFQSTWDGSKRGVIDCCRLMYTPQKNCPPLM